VADGHRDSSIGNLHCLLPKPNHPPSTSDNHLLVAQRRQQSRLASLRQKAAQSPSFSSRYGRITSASKTPAHTIDGSTRQLNEIAGITRVYMKREKTRKQSLCPFRREAGHRWKELGVRRNPDSGTRSHTIALSTTDRCDRRFKASGRGEISPT